MPDIIRIDVSHSTHGTLLPGQVHHVVLGVPAFQNPHVYVTHRRGAEPLYIDFTYPEQLPPATDTLSPERENTFVVMPGQTFRIDPGYRVSEVALCCAAEAAYSVMMMW